MALDERTKALQEDRNNSFKSNPLTEQILGRADEFEQSLIDQGIDIDEFKRQQAPREVDIDLESYQDYLSAEQIDPIYGDIDEDRAQAQSGIGLVGKALAQSVTELTLGTLEGLGYLADAPATVYNGLKKNLITGGLNQLGKLKNILIMNGFLYIKQKLHRKVNF